MSRRDPCPCAACGQPFAPAIRTQVYCSRRCRDIAWGRSQRLQREMLAKEQRRVALEGDARSWGRWGTRTAARDALRARMAQDGGWWGPPMVARWAELHGVPFEGVLELLTELSLEGQVHARGRELAQWRAA